MVVTTRRKKQRLVKQKKQKNQPSLLHENLGLMDEVNRTRNSFKRKPSFKLGKFLAFFNYKILEFSQKGIVLLKNMKIFPWSEKDTIFCRKPLILNFSKKIVKKIKIR